MVAFRCVFVALLLAGSGACSASEGAPSLSADGSVSGSLEDGGVEGLDASKEPDAKVVSDGGSSKTDSATSPDGGGDSLQASPPAGFSKCGSGLITTASALSACQGFDDSSPVRPKACDGATLTGGSWELWCKGDDRWVWARFDDVRTTATFPCPAVSAIVGASQSYTTTGGWGGGDWNYTSCKSDLPGCQMSTNVAATLTIERTLKAGSGGAVSQALYVTATPPTISCPSPAPSPYPRVVLGVVVDVK